MEFQVEETAMLRPGVRGQKVGHIWGDAKRPVGAAGGRGQGEGMGSGRASKLQGTVGECSTSNLTGSDLLFIKVCPSLEWGTEWR